MKTKIILVLMVLVLTSAAMALPSINGLRGVYNIIDAKPIGANEIAFSIVLSYWNNLDKIDNLHYLWMGDDTTLAVEDKEQIGEGLFTIDYGVTSFMEIAATISYLGSVYERDLPVPRYNHTGKWDEIYGMGDIYLGVKFGFSPTPSTEVLWLGLQNWFEFAPRANHTLTNIAENSDDYRYDGMTYNGMPMFHARFPRLSTGHTNWGVGGLISVDLAYVWPSSPFRMHINVGYSQYKQTIEMWDFISDGSGTLSDSVNLDQLVEDNVLDLGFAFEFPTEFAVIYTELSAKHYLDRNEYNTVAYFSPGIRFLSSGGIVLDVNFNMGLTAFPVNYYDFGHSLYQAEEEPTPGERAQLAPLPCGGTNDWGISTTIGFSSDLIVHAPVVTTGTVSGIISDAETGAPIVASIEFPGTPVSSVVTDPATGYFTSTVPAGSVPVTVSAPGYIPASATVVLVEGQDVVADFNLEEQKMYGTIAGTVIEYNSDAPLLATVTITGPEEPLSVQTGDDGVYQFEAPAGTWTIKADAPDFVSRSRAVVIAADQTSIQDFQLRPVLVEGQELSFDNIYFESGSAVIKPQSYPVLNSMIEILIENPNAMVQIAGHTDSDGSSGYNQTLSEERAASVYAYFIQNGVQARTLTAVGFGENMPEVPNTSVANKAMNRRIVFTVLSNN